MLRTTPIADIKTTNEVLPALMNGSGSPVGGIRPVTTQKLRIDWIAMIEVMPAAR